MSKYSDNVIHPGALQEIVEAVSALEGLEQSFIHLDHVQVANDNDEIIGKLQFTSDGEWVFMPRKHDKPATLGE